MLIKKIPDGENNPDTLSLLRSVIARERSDRSNLFDSRDFLLFPDLKKIASSATQTRNDNAKHFFLLSESL
jgi:hypothetical protein